MHSRTQNYDYYFIARFYQSIKGLQLTTEKQIQTINILSPYMTFYLTGKHFTSYSMSDWAPNGDI